MPRRKRFQDKIQMVVPLKMKEDLDRICDRNTKKMSEVIRELITEYIEREEAKGKPQ